MTAERRESPVGSNVENPSAAAGLRRVEGSDSSRILIIRHRESTWNAERRWTGQADPALSAVGAAQAMEIAPVLVELGFETLVSSDLQRAVQTVDIVAERFPNATLLVDPRLRERDVPSWSGLTRDEIQARWPCAYGAWRKGDLADAPDAEPWANVQRRVTEALLNLLERPSQTLVVAHSGVLRVLRTEAGAAELPGRSKGIWVDKLGGRLHAGSLQRVRPRGNESRPR